MKKLLSALLLAWASICIAGQNPVLQNPYTTNTPTAADLHVLSLFGGGTNVVQVIKTNFVSGKFFTNNFGATITVRADVLFPSTNGPANHGFILWGPFGSAGSSSGEIGRVIKSGFISNDVVPLFGSITNGGVYCFSNVENSSFNVTLLNNQIEVLAAGSSVTVNTANAAQATNLASNSTLFAPTTITNMSDGAYVNIASSSPGGMVITLVNTNLFHGSGDIANGTFSINNVSYKILSIEDAAAPRTNVLYIQNNNFDPAITIVDNGTAAPDNIIAIGDNVIGSTEIALQARSNIVFFAENSINGRLFKMDGPSNGLLDFLNVKIIDAITHDYDDKQGTQVIDGTVGLVVPRTNAAPANVTLGVTAPDFWATNIINGTKVYTPYWKAH